MAARAMLYLMFVCIQNNTIGCENSESYQSDAR